MSSSTDEDAVMVYKELRKRRRVRRRLWIHSHNNKKRDSIMVDKKLESEQKRRRDANYTRSELRRLVHLVCKKAKIVENKKTDSGTLADKANEWQRIAKEHNATTGTIRTPEKLRQKYESIKKDVKRKVSINKKEINQSDGESVMLEDYEKELLDILTITDDGSSHQCDGDAEIIPTITIVKMEPQQEVSEREFNDPLEFLQVFPEDDGENPLPLNVHQQPNDEVRNEEKQIALKIQKRKLAILELELSNKKKEEELLLKQLELQDYAIALKKKKLELLEK